MIYFPISLDMEISLPSWGGLGWGLKEESKVILLQRLHPYFDSFKYYLVQRYLCKSSL